MAYLEIETRDGVQHIALDRDHLSVGRLAYNDVVLPFAQISRQHAELRRIKGQWWIADLHSTNGLHVDSRRISEHALQDGDRILLAPGIALRFVNEAVPQQAPAAQPTASAGGRPQRPPAPPGSRSPYAADEALYVPPGMAPSTPPLLPSMPMYGRTMPTAPSSNGAQPSYGPSADPAGSQHLASGGRSGATPARDSSAMGGYPVGGYPVGGYPVGGYPMPSGPPVGGEGGDPYRRSTPAGARPVVPTVQISKLLHICQTCGQLTAPDAIYCQSCHQPLARECPMCRLNLLPIQERCPRCHTPNAAYVGKARSTPPPA